MRIWKIILIFLGLVLTSFYLFPIELGPANTKLMMAVFGIPAFLVNAAKKGISRANNNLILLILFATLVSFTSWIAIIVNSTNDITYVSYVVSMFVWLGGAYTLVLYLDYVHGCVDVETVCKYLIVVGAIQCLLAIIIDTYPSVERFFLRVNLLKQGHVNYARKADRLFGIGCYYDTGGIRLASILVIGSYLLKTIIDSSKKWIIILYIAALFVIEIFGSMISRTTTIGFMLGGLYILYRSGIFSLSINKDYIPTMKWLMGSVVVASLVIGAYYVSNDQFRKNFRFGFEGFVSLVEEGEWNVSSNDRLMTMYRWPDSLHTWVIGDGYIDSTDNDPYYTGVRYKGYYKATDVGYLRFIYYGGILMLCSFIGFFIWVAHTCSSYFPRYKMMFWLLFILQMAIWLKVASDIFCVSAIFIALGIFLNLGRSSSYDEEISNCAYE